MMRLACATLIAAGLAAPAMAQPLAPLVNGSFDTLDTVWFGIARPAGYRLYNSTRYRRTDDGQLPAAVTRGGSAGSIFLPGALGVDPNNFTAVHAEEFRTPGNPLSGRNWPEYLFDPPSGAAIRVSCWINIPASDPLVGGRFGLKIEFKRSGDNFSNYDFVEWLDIDPAAAVAPPGTVIVPFVDPPVGSTLTGGPGIHTNGQWIKFERTYQQSQFGSFAEPPTNPARASILALRFSNDLNSFGTVWVDDLVFEQVTAAPPCTADFDGSGTANIDDIFIFLNAWFANCTGQAGPPCNGRNADINNNGLNIDDIFIFLNLWFAGCPTP
jgi:hypothetical protein